MEKRSWSSQWGFVAAAAGAAVGLGNIWSFPRYLEQHGAPFLAAYLIMAVLAGWPLLMAEIAVGRDTGCGARGAFKELCGSALPGWAAECASLLMMGFYSVLGGCCLRYMLINLAGVFSGGAGGGLGLFLGYISNVPLSALFTVLFIAAAAVITAAPVRSGLERFSKFAVPLLALMLPGLIACSLRLPGAESGIAKMFAVPEQGGIAGTIDMLGDAACQLFFSLSIGQGVMALYGAYLPREASIPKCALAVVAADTLIAVLAGFAVVPAAEAAGGGGGTMMMFTAMQEVFASLGSWGAMFGFLFYLLVLLAALTSAVSLLEVVGTWAGAKAGRKQAALFAAALSAVPAIAIARDGLGFGALPEIFGLSWLSAAELASEGILMPAAALAMAFALRRRSRSELLRRQLGYAAGRCTGLAMRSAAVVLIAAALCARIL